MKFLPLIVCNLLRSRRRTLLTIASIALSMSVRERRTAIVTLRREAVSELRTI
ncbi:MAG TPA: hypothetical protein VIX59_16530 [Candidatus Binataceae bacterium]|jgi:hypothetical protein